MGFKRCPAASRPGTVLPGAGAEVPAAPVPAVDPGAPLPTDQLGIPVLWADAGPVVGVSCTSELLAGWVGRGRTPRAAEFGHDAAGVHFLVTRGWWGGLRREGAAGRFSYRLVLRNEGGRFRGLPRFDDPRRWHRPLLPGVMFALDRGSPHEWLHDARWPGEGGSLLAVVAVDRDMLLPPGAAWSLLARFRGAVMPAAERAAQRQASPQ